MKVIGLTGGIGSGKSTVARFLAELGAVIIDADKVGHEALQPGSEVQQQVVAAFGRQIIAADGNINRARLGRIVFDNPEALAKLNRSVWFFCLSNAYRAVNRVAQSVCVSE